MRQILFTMTCVCMTAALCEQLLDGSRFFPAIRLVLGMEIASMVLGGVLTVWRFVNG